MSKRIKCPGSNKKVRILSDENGLYIKCSYCDAEYELAVGFKARRGRATLPEHYCENPKGGS